MKIVNSKKQRVLKNMGKTLHVCENNQLYVFVQFATQKGSDNGKL